MKLRHLVVAVVAFVAPVAGKAPRADPARGSQTVSDLVGRCAGLGLSGKPLADAAVGAVAQAFGDHSVWHLWESPERALARGRGWSQQYNTVLLKVLRGLGFDARLVHAARVRGFGHPWWLAGHTWVRVMIDGHEVDACASRLDNVAGRSPFVPLTPVLPVRLSTRWAVALALAPFVVVAVWRAWLTGEPVAPWVYGPRGTS